MRFTSPVDNRAAIHRDDPTYHPSESTTRTGYAYAENPRASSMLFYNTSSFPPCRSTSHRGPSSRLHKPIPPANAAAFLRSAQPTYPDRREMFHSLRPVASAKCVYGVFPTSQPRLTTLVVPSLAPCRWTQRAVREEKLYPKSTYQPKDKENHRELKMERIPAGTGQNLRPWP